MNKARIPGTPKKNPRDLDGKKELQVKSFWKKHCLPDESLKAFAKRCAMSSDDLYGTGSRASAASWLHNKRANFTRPPLGIGNTRKKKSSQGGGKK